MLSKHKIQGKQLKFRNFKRGGVLVYMLVHTPATFKKPAVCPLYYSGTEPCSIHKA
jgi:hypothetical protein